MRTYLDSSFSRQELMEGSCADGNEYFESITDEEFFYQQNDSAAWS